jgi:hypothetical protein
VQFYNTQQHLTFSPIQNTIFFSRRKESPNTNQWQQEEVNFPEVKFLGDSDDMSLKQTYGATVASM